jgi:uncharacterized protein YkwD
MLQIDDQQPLFNEQRNFMMRQIYCILFLALIFKGASCCATKNNSCILSTADPIEILEEKMITEINRIRLEEGLNPLKTWSQLTICAREHSQNMANKKCHFGHDGFKKRAHKIEKITYLLSIAENVAHSYNYKDPVKVAIHGWMKSSGHRTNILGDYEETGVGVAISEDGKFFVTQLFAKRYN